MSIANKWAQGQLFAFSALDGDSFFGDDFVGTLSGDRLGIRFHTKVKRELVFLNRGFSDLVFDAVTGDYISCRIGHGQEIKIFFKQAHLIVGTVCEATEPTVFVEGKATCTEVDSVLVQDTKDGEVTALAVSKNCFAFAFAKTGEEAVFLAKSGISQDMEQLEAEKKSFYENHDIPEEYEALYTKCLSVMKTQLYSPEGSMKGIWSTPDRLPHRHLWLWDSVFHAIGHRHLSCELAEALICAIFYNQREDGFIPHLANPEMASKISQPPVIAWGAYRVYEMSKNQSFLKKVYERNQKFLQWMQTHRRKTDEELYVWHTSENVHCRCDESGMDNSPRFDDVKDLQAIDFSCFMANEVRYMKKIAEVLELWEEANDYEDWYQQIAKAINHKLWDEEEGFYFDYNLEKNELHKVYSVASFLPLFAGICSKKQAESLISFLNRPDMFATEFPIPSIAVCDKTFGSDMWRGPVWINYNYMISEGLFAYGFSEKAREIRIKTIAFMKEWYEKTGTFYEFYDCLNQKAPSCLNRKGLPTDIYDISVRMQSIRDYGWSSTLLCDMIKSRQDQ